jgi:ABC-type branched-subunit amino acid transport system substrate-binding protein
LKYFNMKIWIILLLIPVTAFSSSRSLMDQALKDFERKNYYDAYVIFHKVYHQLPVEVNPYASTSLFMMIRSLYFQNRHEEVIQKAGIFTEQFPESRYLDHVLYTKCASLMKSGSYFTAASFALRTIYVTDEDILRQKALDLARNITLHYLSQEEIEGLRAFVHTRKELRSIELLLAEKMKEKGDKAAAGKILEGIRTSLMELFEVNYFNRILNELKENVDKRIDLAVILPLSGSDSSSGNALLHGMIFALDRFKKDVSYDVNLIIMDNESDILKSVKQAGTASSMKGVIAIIGPLKSDDAIAMAPVCDYEKIPLFMPTATRDGLAALSPFLFQLNPDQDERAYALASYATDSLNFETFAILAPADDYGRRISDSFIETVSQKGGRVIRREWFSDPNDLKSQFRNIRKDAFEIQAADTLDTNNVLLDSELDLKTESDSLKITLNTIDAFFLPVYHNQIESVAPQLAFYNFETRLLGDGNWLDENLLSRYRRYVNGIVISADHVMLNTDDRVKYFRNAYYSETERNADRLTMYGYETMVLLLNLIENGNTSREGIRRAVHRMGEFKGVIRNIRFSDRNPRVNTAVRILEFRNNSIFMLKE